MTNLVLVLLRMFVVTNTVPGWIGGPDIVLRTNSDGFLAADSYSTLAIAITRPPKCVVVTNYVFGVRMGTNALELLTLEKQGAEMAFTAPSTKAPVDYTNRVVWPLDLPASGVLARPLSGVVEMRP